MRPRRCYLHVGCPKTGTTYLQSIMWKSRRQLREQGLEPALRQRSDSFFLTLGLRERFDPEYDGPRVLQVMDRLAAGLADGRTEDLIISHELLAAVAPEGVQRLRGMLEGFEVHVVVTARDLARQIPAEWQQTVKTRSRATYPTFLENVRDRRDSRFWTVQDPADVAERWGVGLPPQNVHVVTVPPASSPTSLLVERFYSVLDVDPASLDTDVARSNPSLGYAQAELLRRVNATLGDRLPHPRAGYNVAVKGWLGEHVLSRQDGQRIGLPAEHHEWVGAAARETVERLTERGYHVVGDLADLVPEPPTGTEVPQVVPDDELVEAALEALATMVAERGDEALEKKRAKAATAAGSAVGSSTELLRRAPASGLVARAARRLRAAAGR
jgi:hypothetical protein